VDGINFLLHGSSPFRVEMGLLEGEIVSEVLRSEILGLKLDMSCEVMKVFGEAANAVGAARLIR
jgi:hypothetical protein